MLLLRPWLSVSEYIIPGNQVKIKHILVV